MGNTEPSQVPLIEEFDRYKTVPRNLTKVVDDMRRLGQKYGFFGFGTAEGLEQFLRKIETKELVLDTKTLDAISALGQDGKSSVFINLNGVLYVFGLDAYVGKPATINEEMENVREFGAQDLKRVRAWMLDALAEMGFRVDKNEWTEPHPYQPTVKDIDAWRGIGKALAGIKVCQNQRIEFWDEWPDEDGPTREEVEQDTADEIAQYKSKWGFTPAGSCNQKVIDTTPSDRSMQAHAMLVTGISWAA